LLAVWVYVCDVNAHVWVCLVSVKVLKHHPQCEEYSVQVIHKWWHQWYCWWQIKSNISSL